MKIRFDLDWHEKSIEFSSWCENALFTGASCISKVKDLRSWMSPTICCLPSLSSYVKDPEDILVSKTVVELPVRLGTYVLTPKDASFYYRVIPYERTKSHQYRYNHEDSIDFETLDEALKFLEDRQTASGKTWSSSSEDVNHTINHKSFYEHSYFKSDKDKISEEGYCICRMYDGADLETDSFKEEALVCNC